MKSINSTRPICQVYTVGIVEVNLGSVPFAMRSFSQGQKLVKLDVKNIVPNGEGHYKVGRMAPPNGMVAPVGYYMAFAINQGVPSFAHWVQLMV